MRRRKMWHKFDRVLIENIAITLGITEVEAVTILAREREQRLIDAVSRYTTTDISWGEFLVDVKAELLPICNSCGVHIHRGDGLVVSDVWLVGIDQPQTRGQGAFHYDCFHSLTHPMG